MSAWSPAPRPLFPRQLTATIETLAPLHVGDGQGRRVADVDFVVHRGQIYLIDPRKLWDRVGAERLAHWNEAEFRLSDLLEPTDYPACAAAVIPIQGHLEVAGGLLDQIADLQGRPYLPGSSLKGAIRSALLRAAGVTPDLEAILTSHASRQWVGQVIERSVFGRNPNHDLLRALRVFDSAPVDPSVRRAVVVAIYSRRGGRLEAKGPSHRLNVVAFPAGTRLTARLSLDEFTRHQPSLAWPPERREMAPPSRCAVPGGRGPAARPRAALLRGGGPAGPRSVLPAAPRRRGAPRPDELPPPDRLGDRLAGQNARSGPD